MYAELYKYLILHKQVSIPGIGRFEIEKRPADVDFASRIISPANYTISFRQVDNIMPSRKFFNWLGEELGIPEMEAVMRFNDFAYDLRNKLTPDNQMHWGGVGTLKKWLNGEIMFEPIQKEPTLESAVPAKKVIRGKAQHRITVGEQEKTSNEMMELLFPEKEEKSHWWTVPLIIAIAAFIYIAFYFSTNGVSIHSAANQQKLSPAKTTNSR